MSAERAVQDDLLRLGVLAAQVAAALLWVRGPDGEWSVASYGVGDSVGGDDRRLVELIVGAAVPVEVADLAAVLTGSPVVRSPWSMRWGFGVALRDEAGRVVGVAVLLDRWVRTVDRRTAMTMRVLRRQLERSFRLRDVESADNPLSALPWPDPASTPRGAPAISDMPPGPDLLNASEVAQLLGVRQRTVTNWAAEGKLPSVRTVGGHYRFRRRDLAARWSTFNAPMVASNRRPRGDARPRRVRSDMPASAPRGR